jgi:hypothetical protein
MTGEAPLTNGGARRLGGSRRRTDFCLFCPRLSLSLGVGGQSQTTGTGQVSMLSHAWDDRTYAHYTSQEPRPPELYGRFEGRLGPKTDIKTGDGHV